MIAPNTGRFFEESAIYVLLYRKLRITQADISSIFGIAQPTISKKINRELEENDELENFSLRDSCQIVDEYFTFYHLEKTEEMEELINEFKE